MTDPWAEVRASKALDAIEKSRSHDGSSVVTVTAVEFLALKDDARIIETDADALLAVVRAYATHEDVCDHADPCSCGYSAALPEHLR